MAYEKQTWKTGDIITEEKLNHMEDGIASVGVLIVNEYFDEFTEKQTLDKTWKEIYDALMNGIIVYLKCPDESSKYYIYALRGLSFTDGYFAVFDERQYSTDSENGYPTFFES